MWTAVRTTYFEADLSPLLGQCIRPLVASIRPQFNPERVIVQPHWKHGLHVNVAFKLADESQRAEIEQLCLTEIGAWLAQNPSTTTLDEASYLSSSEQMGRLEGETGPYLPLLDNNQVVLVPYSSRPFQNSDALGDVWEQFLDGSLDSLLALAELRKPSLAAFYRQLTAMFVAVGQLAGPQGLAHGHLSFRAHGEGFLVHSPNARPRFDKANATLGPIVANSIRTELAGWTNAADDVLATWRPVLQRAFDQILAIVGQQVPEGMAVSSASFAQRPASWNESALAGAMQSPEAIALFNSPGHIAYRVIINQFYRFLPIIGVSPIERFTLTYVIASQCEEILNVDWQKIFYNKRSHENA